MSRLSTAADISKKKPAATGRCETLKIAWNIFFFLNLIHSYIYYAILGRLESLICLSKLAKFPCEESRVNFHTYSRAQVSFSIVTDANDGNHCSRILNTFFVSTRLCWTDLEKVGMFIYHICDSREATLHDTRIFMCRLTLGQSQEKERPKIRRTPMFTQI